MAVNFTDHATVLAEYDAVLNREANWLLLAYDSSAQTDDTFQLVASGSNGLPELKSKIDDPQQIFVAFYREGNDGFILLNIIPESVSGVRRARALVHSRRIGTVLQAHQTSLTVDHLSNLTPKAIKSALASPDSVHVIQVDRVTAEPTVDEMGQFTEPPMASTSPSQPTPTPPPSKGSGSVFSSLLRRKKKPEFDNEFGPIEPFSLYLEDVPPPPPPKDASGGRRSLSMQPPEHPRREEQHSSPRASAPRPPQLLTTHHRSNSDYMVVNRRESSSSDEVVVVKPESPIPGAGPSHAPPRSPGIKKRSVTMPSKWTTLPLDPTERARQRERIQRERQIEEQRALEEEAQRQRRIKTQKEAFIREQEEEEEHRRRSIENELQHATAQRRRREELERREEERKQRELEQKKRAARERRIEEHRRLEEWRHEQAAQAEKAAQQAEQARRKEEEERKKKIQLASSKIKNTKADLDLTTGWVTIQTGDSLVWRRRYFKFVGSAVFFYRSQKERDSGQVLEQVDLRGKVRALREWNEGYEDLKAIPFSFAVEFNDAREPWSMFSDSEEEKYKLLGLLHTANTLSIGMFGRG